MPTTAYTQAAKEALASAPSNVVILETLEISHPAVTPSYFLVKDRQDHTFTLEDDTEQLFEGAAFRFTLPDVGTNGIQNLSLTLDNVDERITDFINTAKVTNVPALVKYRSYRSDDLTTPLNSPPIILFLRDISVSIFEATSAASFADLINKKFPNKNYDRKTFVSLGT